MLVRARIEAIASPVPSVEVSEKGGGGAGATRGERATGSSEGGLEDDAAAASEADAGRGRGPRAHAETSASAATTAAALRVVIEEA